MLNTPLKKLINHAANIIALFEMEHSSVYTIVPYMEAGEEDSENVTIKISHDIEEGLSDLFLEPLSDYCKAKYIAWKVSISNNQFLIEIS